MATKKSADERIYTLSDIAIRLDVIIRLLIEANTKNEKFNKTNIIPLLNSVGLDPTDIAKIYGKKKAADISSSLYKKKDTEAKSWKN